MPSEETELQLRAIAFKSIARLRKESRIPLALDYLITSIKYRDHTISELRAIVDGIEGGLKE